MLSTSRKNRSQWTVGVDGGELVAARVEVEVCAPGSVGAPIVGASTSIRATLSPLSDCVPADRRVQPQQRRRDAAPG